MKADVVCLQETRAAAGRWSTGGWLSWRSGGIRGQYGCEVWLRPAQLDPPLTIQSCRILAADPRFIVVSCLGSRLLLTVCSARAPHADRPAEEKAEFWRNLKAVLHRVPQGRSLCVGIDANADFCARDEGMSLIGELLGQHDMTSNDEYLFEFATALGLEAPATWTHLQRGAIGRWAPSSASQAWDLDIVNQQRDHVALRVHTRLRGTLPVGRVEVPRRSTSHEVVSAGARLWAAVRDDLTSGRPCGAVLSSFHNAYRAWIGPLPRKPPTQPRQPYISPATLSRLEHLRDWRSHLRFMHRAVRDTARRLVFARWRGRPASVGKALLHTLRLQREYAAALALEETRLQRVAHQAARRDKQRHFEGLLGAAAAHWHEHGRPMEAITQLRWASRRAAERRQVQAAGGYNIEAELEEQFRAQEQATRLSTTCVGPAVRPWLQQPAEACKSAMPTLLQLEAACRRQAANKAPGPDGVCTEVWKFFPAQAGKWLWAVMSRIALTGREPAHFKAAIYCALYKKGPASLPQNYRAIALLNGVAKIWHGFLRKSLGQAVLAGYDSTQLGGKPGIPVAFAIAAYRAAVELSVQQQRSVAVLFVDIQAAYYEVSRRLIFQGEELSGELSPLPDHRHLECLVEHLRTSGALELLGVSPDERALLRDCVEFSYWQLAGSRNVYLASRVSRPGLADILFGALFAIALRHIKAACAQAGIALQAAGSFIGATDEVLPLGWADDLAIVADFDSPTLLLRQLPQFVGIVLSTLELLRFRINLGLSKTELMLDIRGPDAKSVRGRLLTEPSTLSLPTGHQVRISPEYRYLGVITAPRDTGRRDSELSAQRVHAAWSHAKSLLACPTLPWRLKQAWVGGRVLPAAYATLSTSIAGSARATAPLQGFFERAARQLVGSWRYGHYLTRAALVVLLGLSAPEDACVIARARLAVQLCTRAPFRVSELFEAVWSRATPWGTQLTDACRMVLAGCRGWSPGDHVTLPGVRRCGPSILKACKHLSRYGSAYRAFIELWAEITSPRVTQVIGVAVPQTCCLCSSVLPSAQALAAHIHRKHSVAHTIHVWHGVPLVQC